MSVGADANVEAAWDALADQRKRELSSGAVEAIPLEVVIASLEARFQER